MFSLRKSKKVINIVIEDYVLRIVETSGHNISSIKMVYEKPLPAGIIVHGKVADEIQFYNYMRDLVKELGLKNRLVRFYVPDSLVIMRQVEFPAHLKNKKEIKEYFGLEIGKSIHLPFKKPILDIHYLPYETSTPSRDGIEGLNEISQGTLFAASEEVMKKYTEIFVDVSLKPIVADLKAFGVYRYFQHMQEVNIGKAYLFVELNLTSIHLNIFRNHQLEFLRFQDLDLILKGWQSSGQTDDSISWQFEDEESVIKGIVDDQILELERIMNFYRFSLHKGEESVTDIVIIGDHPYKQDFYQKMKSQIDLPINLLQNHETKAKEISSFYIPALGLALEGGELADEARS
ncbi:type IV pilus biogenesis protein PilM [Oceanobacillus chungangensis]|uniref:Pilus assembly protein PilM n=1 Tax=Oceanobacillus chungangensis TaxID=1229152 RepID=A0A3D8Q157_9BACI|nr:pilus assembly protein PilM [Oceanobacillus chungangensis]RDW21567.1 hypothetical protein CWR45_01450 [Oceanobacillus chungangensis]